MEHRRPLRGVAALFLVNGILFGSWLPRLPEIRDRLALGLDEVGLVLAAANIGGLVGSALSGPMVGRLGARRTALVPALCLVVLLPGVGVAPNLAILVGLLVALGLADALADVGMNALAVRQQELRGRSIFTRMHALWSIGSLVGAGSSTLAAGAGTPLTLQLGVTAVVGVAVVVAAARVLPATETRPRLRNRARLVLVVAVAGAAAALIEGAPHEWSAIYLTDVLGATPAVAGLGFVLLTVGMIVGRLAGDRFVDALGPRRTITTGLVLVGVALVGVTAFDTRLAALLAFGLWGFGVSVIIPLLYGMAGSHRDFGEGSGLAAMSVGMRIGFMAGPTLVGATATAASLPTALIVVVGGALVAAMVVIFRAL